MEVILNDLDIGYEDALCCGIKLSLRLGKIYVLMGDNGLGKTTLFKTLSGIVQPLSGSVVVNQGSSKSFAFVGTKRPEVEFLTVREYLTFGQQGLLAEQEIGKVLDLLSMGNFLDQELTQMSDGQFKKLALARQLLKRKKVLLLDEPSAYLDVKNKVILGDLLNSLKSTHLIFLSTHDVDFAKKYGDEFYELANKRINTYSFK